LLIDRLELKGKSVADVGTGSGILALAAARAGAEQVVAVDINPYAVTATRENARRTAPATASSRSAHICSPPSRRDRSSM
jgi:ribosomal protein L11 methylase PrmA